MPETEIRPYKERLLDGFERSRIRTELQKVKRSRLDTIKKRYATMVLGASLAVGGIGLPLKSLSAPNAPAASDSRESSGPNSMERLSADLRAANEIARSVTGGVTAAAATITSPLSSSQTADRAIAQSKEQMKEAFFAKEIPFGKLIYSEAKKNDLPPELVAAVVQQESKFIPNARSHANAQGLMQLMPRTGKWMGANNLMNPAENVKAGTKYLKYLNGRFDGDQRRVIAAYNAGEGNVKRFGGIPPFKETQNYVKKVMSYQQDYDDRLSGHVAEALETRLPDAR